VYLYNETRWEELAKANALFTRPALNLDEESSYEYLGLESLGISKECIAGMRVLCLASGGGQQSAAFALLGANVSVLDISWSQLERDQLAAEHYGVSINTYQGDMRDLSCFENDYFDIIWQPYSLTFVPDSRVVFSEVSRVIKQAGFYYLMCANPFFTGMTHYDWNGEGYVLKTPYENGVVTSYPDQDWVYDKAQKDIQRPIEYKQTFKRIINSLINQGFLLTYFSEVKSDNTDAKAGSWEHFTNIAPPWVEFVWRYYPSPEAMRIF